MRAKSTTHTTADEILKMRSWHYFQPTYGWAKILRQTVQRQKWTSWRLPTRYRCCWRAHTGRSRQTCRLPNTFLFLNPTAAAASEWNFSPAVFCKRGQIPVWSVCASTLCHCLLLLLRYRPACRRHWWTWRVDRATVNGPGFCASRLRRRLRRRWK